MGFTYILRIILFFVAKIVATTFKTMVPFGFEDIIVKRSGPTYKSDPMLFIFQF